MPISTNSKKKQSLLAATIIQFDKFYPKQILCKTLTKLKTTVNAMHINMK